MNRFGSSSCVTINVYGLPTENPLARRAAHLKRRRHRPQPPHRSPSPPSRQRVIALRGDSLQTPMTPLPDISRRQGQASNKVLHEISLRDFAGITAPSPVSARPSAVPVSADRIDELSNSPDRDKSLKPPPIGHFVRFLRRALNIIRISNCRFTLHGSNHGSRG